MKQGIVAVLALGCVGTVLAQSQVSLYGSMDISVPWVSDIRGKSTVRTDGAISQPDLWGLRGSEDLGSGLKASFQLENGFLSDIGAMISPGRLFNRASWVGLEGAAGAFTFGRQVDFTAGTLSQWGNGYQLYNFYLYHPGNLDGLSSQFPVDNAIAYRSPRMGGVQLGALYGLGEVPGRQSANRTYSLAATYAGARLNLALAYTNAEGRAFDIAGSTGLTQALGRALTPGQALALDSFRSVGIGGGYRLESLPISLNALYTRSTLEAGAARGAMSAMDMGLAWSVAPATTLNLGYSFSKFEQTRWRQLHLGARYAFSKRTQIYASGTHQRASNGLAAMNAVGVASGRSQSVVNLGVHTSF